MYKERITNLMKAVKDDSVSLDFIEDRVNAFTEYMGHTAWMETRIQRLTIEGIRGEQWRDEVAKLDRLKRDKHEVAMDAINQLNRLCETYGLDPFYDKPVDNEHRNQVGDDIGKIVNEYFEGRDVWRLEKKDLMDEDFVQAVNGISNAEEGLRQ